MTAGLLALLLWPLVEKWEESMGLRVLFGLRGARPTPSQVVVVAIDRETSRKLQLPIDPDRWPRSLHAVLLKRLFQAGAPVVAFDLVFERPQPEDEDRRFAAALAQHQNVILCQRLELEYVSLYADDPSQHYVHKIERLTPLNPIISKDAAALVPFPLPKRPIRVSQFWTFKATAGETPTLPVATLQLFLQTRHGGNMARLRNILPVAGTATDPLDQQCRQWRAFFRSPAAQKPQIKATNPSTNVPGQGQLLEVLQQIYTRPDSRYLNFYGPPGTIATIPYHAIVNPDGTPTFNDLAFLAGKAVFVGVSERNQPQRKDGFYTVFSQRNGIDLSGVEIGATAFANLLDQQCLQPVDAPLANALIFTWSAFVTLLCYRLPGKMGAGVLLLLSGSYLMLAQVLFNRSNLWLPLITPVLIIPPGAFFGTLVLKYADSSRKRRNIQKAFEHYLPAEVVARYASSIERLKDAGEELYATCLYTDAERYTTLSEKLTPSELRRFMNHYFEILFEPVIRNEGNIAQVQGDGMLALWPTNRDQTQLRRFACLAALQAQQKLLAERAAKATSRVPHTRMGLHAGPLFVGNIGAGKHFQYQPTGDTVNTAARIENLNKALGTRILASADVLASLEDILAREVGRFVLMGKKKPMVLFELVGLKTDASASQNERLEKFAEGLTAFRKGAWEEAITCFDALENTFGEDGPSRFYIELCKQYRRQPPGKDHDGTIWLKHK